MNIQKATELYEEWLSKELTILPEDLVKKHEAMSAGAFPFFRATFYRWMQVWPEVCEELDRAPEVLAVGDLHVENFGTWRDVEGRLVWGINDFDEAYNPPYTIALVRLAASAHMAISEARLSIETKDACDFILTGYVDGLESGGEPLVMGEKHPWLRSMVTGVLREPEPFWQKMDALPTVRKPIPGSARRGIERMMPGKGLACRLVHRIAGLGSLGRERYVALAEYHGGRVAREAKALAASACVWVNAETGSRKIRYQQALDDSVRCADPFVRVQGRWIVRRLAPDCSRVELTSIPKERDESRLLKAMGFETANVHLGSSSTKAILNHLKKKPKEWLHQASHDMMKATLRDREDWRESRKAMAAKRGASKRKSRVKAKK